MTQKPGCQSRPPAGTSRPRQREGLARDRTSAPRNGAAGRCLRVDADLERQWRLGTALHDDLCQDLAGASFACESFRQEVDPECKHGGAALGRVGDMILQALAKARRIADELDPVAPRPDGLTIALGELAARSAVNAGAVVQFTTRRSVDVGDRHIAVHLFRVAERAVQDALMMNGAKRVTITLARAGSALQLTVAASKLPQPARVRPDRSAWRTSIEKIKALGGRLTIATSSRTGATTVACVLPEGREMAGLRTI